MYTLSGSEALSFADVAQKISSVSGQEINYINVPADAFVGGLQKHGMPEGAARFLAFLFDLLKQGTEEEVLPDTETVLGRKPITFDSYYDNHPDDFITPYAVTDPGEDIAESFSEFIIAEKPTDLSLIKNQKVDYFWQFPEFVTLREEIRGNLKN